MFNLLVTTKAPGILHVSSRYQWFFLFTHKNLVLLFFSFSSHKLGRRINSQLATLNWMQNCCWIQCEGVSLENVFSSFFLPHRSAVKRLTVKIMHAFHVNELELTWSRSDSILTVITGKNIPLETCTQATFSFSSVSVII